jgi:hypothetical protein
MGFSTFKVGKNIRLHIFRWHEERLNDLNGYEATQQELVDTIDGVRVGGGYDHHFMMKTRHKYGDGEYIAIYTSMDKSLVLAEAMKNTKWIHVTVYEDITNFQLHSEW